VARAIDQDTPVRLSLVIPAITAAVTIASAAGVAFFQTRANAEDIKEEKVRAVAKDQAHDLSAQKQEQAQQTLTEAVRELKEEVREGRREQGEKLDRLLRDRRERR
jgi:hypothetical protein